MNWKGRKSKHLIALLVVALALSFTPAYADEIMTNATVVIETAAAEPALVVQDSWTWSWTVGTVLSTGVTNDANGALYERYAAGNSGAAESTRYLHGGNGQSGLDVKLQGEIRRQYPYPRRC